MNEKRVRRKLLPLAGARAGADHSPSLTPELIGRVVEDFYASCRSHPELGPIFAAHVRDWGAHLSRIRAFWGAALLGSGGYAGRPLEAHLAIPQLQPRHFSTWLRLFAATVDRHCAPHDAEAFMDRAGKMANRMMAVAKERGSSES
jgi:hemoglobin